MSVFLLRGLALCRFGLFSIFLVCKLIRLYGNVGIDVPNNVEMCISYGLDEYLEVLLTKQ